MSVQERKSRLVAIARHFGIDGEEAEALAGDVLATFLLHDSGSADAEERLERLMTLACARRNAAAEVAGLDPVALRTVLPSFSADLRRVLLLHAVEGLDAHGVAELLNVSPTYAARLIARSVERAKKEILERQRR